MLKKAFLIVSLVGLSGLLASFAPPEKSGQVIKTIIVDAGHGIMDNGGHNGAKGTYSYEDEICLAIAKKLVAKIRETYPDIKVVETRPTENIVALKERANIANRNGEIYSSPFT